MSKKVQATWDQQAAAPLGKEKPQACFDGRHSFSALTQRKSGCKDYYSPIPVSLGKGSPPSLVSSEQETERGQQAPVTYKVVGADITHILQAQLLSGYFTF